MKINCLSCGHNVVLDDAYDDYEGNIKCLACHATLDIKAEDGCLKSVKLFDVSSKSVLDMEFERTL